MIAVNLMAYQKPKAENKIPTRESITFVSKDSWTLPEGAEVKSKEKYVTVREIENGYILEERMEYQYCMKEMEEGEGEVCEHDKWNTETKITYSKTKPKVEIS